MITPTVKPGVLSLGDVFSGAFATYKARFWLFLTIALAPSALIMVIYAFVALGMAVAVGSNAPTSTLVAMVVGFGVLVAVALFVIMLFAYRCYGMIALATRDLGAGYVPGWGDLLQRTKGFMGRIALLMLAAFGAMLVVYTLIFVLLILPFLPLLNGDTSDASLVASFGIALVVVMFVYVAAVIVGVFFMVRWLFLIPVMGVEQVSGFRALGRSWALTRGVFWPTLGFYLVMNLALMVPTALISFTTEAILAPVVAMLSYGADSTAATVGSVILGILGLLLIVAATAVVTPFSNIFTAIMYISRLRALAGEPPSAAFYRPTGAQPYGAIGGVPPTTAPPFGAQHPGTEAPQPGPWLPGGGAAPQGASAQPQAYPQVPPPPAGTPQAPVQPSPGVAGQPGTAPAQPLAAPPAGAAPTQDPTGVPPASSAPAAPGAPQHSWTPVPPPTGPAAPPSSASPTDSPSRENPERSPWARPEDTPPQSS